MAITTVMVVILIIWCTITVLRAPVQLPPNPLHAGVVPLNKESLGWLNGTWFSHYLGAHLIIAFVGFGHSVLAMSGEETLAQVNREIEHPKLKNLEKTGLVIFVYSLLFTSLVSFFAVMIIPDNVRPDYFANLIGGIAMYLVGPTSLKLLFHGFVVLVGVLILAGAQNTSIVGANGVLEPRGGRWRAHQLVSAAASPLRHQLPHHQSDRLHAVAHHRAEPGRCLPIGGALRFRGDLELHHEVAGGAGVAFHRARQPRVESSGQSAHREDGNSHWPHYRFRRCCS